MSAQQQQQLVTSDPTMLINATRSVLLDCPQNRPHAEFYETVEEFAVATALWKVACKLRPALIATTGAPA